MSKYRALRQKNKKAVQTALLITGIFVLVEFIGGLLTKSLALLADAGHMLTDICALALSLFAFWVAERPRTQRMSYGFYRAEILAALINGTALITLVIFITREAFRRFFTIKEVYALPMLIVALGGLLINLICAFILNPYKDRNINTKGAFFHVLADTLGSCGAILASMVILLTDWHYADPIVSLIIATLIIVSAWRLLRDVVSVLMMAAPPHIDLDKLEAAILSVKGVKAAHDLHVWTITSGKETLTAHLDIEKEADQDKMLHQLYHLLEEKFSITHSTLQLETKKRKEHEDKDF